MRSSSTPARQSRPCLHFTGLALLAALSTLAACHKGTPPAPPAAEKPAAAPVAPPSGPAVKDGLISRQTLFASPAQFQGRISPDGARVSWLALRDGALNLFVAGADGKTPPRQVSFGANAVRYHRWTPDSAYILFVRSFASKGTTGVFALNVQTGAVRNLVPVQPGDKVWLAGVSRNWPNTALVRLRRKDAAFFSFYRVNLKTGARTLIAKSPPLATWLTDAELMLRVGVKTLADGGQVWVLRRADASLAPLLRVPPPDVPRTRPLRMDVSSTTLYFIDGRGPGFSALVRLDVQSGDREVLLSGDDGDVKRCFFHPVTGQPLACMINGPMPHWHSLAPGFAQILARLETLLGPQFYILAATSTLQKLVIYSDKPEQPGLYSLYDTGTGKLSTLFQTMPDLGRAALPPTQLLRARSPDGLNLLAYLTPAQTPAPHSAPLLLLPPLRQAGRVDYGFDPLIQWLSNRGYNVLEVNTSGASGLGRRYSRAGTGAGLLKSAGDLAALVQAVHSRALADTARLGAMGWGEGARTVLDLAARKHTLPGGGLTCAVVLNPVLNVADMLTRAGKGAAAPALARWLGTRGGKADAALVRAASPARHPDKIKARILVLQSRANPLLDPYLGRNFVRAVRASGGRAAFVFFPEISQPVADGPDLIPYATLSEAFLADCLGGKAEKPGTDLDNTTFEVNAGPDGLPGLPRH